MRDSVLAHSNCSADADGSDLGLCHHRICCCAHCSFLGPELTSLAVRKGDVEQPHCKKVYVCPQALTKTSEYC